VTEVYAAGESPIAGVDGRALCAAVRAERGAEPLYLERVEELPGALEELIRDGDVILAMGAGNITHVAHALPAALEKLLPPGRRA
jgi:UDP-N-acetylmuramate--alanine ligase